MSAEGISQNSQSTATKDWTRGIATAYQAGAAGGAFFNVVASPYGSGANPVTNLLLAAATDEDAEIDHETIAGLDPNHPNNAGTGGGETLPDPVQAGTDFHNAANTADDTLDQANADAEDDRVTAVTGVRDDLDAGLEVADVTWGGTMDTAGAALGSALDGIQDFDWQHVRNYVGAVTGARRSAEIGALTAQVGFVGSYYNSLNSYTASIATASVTHATAYAQSTADYYVTTADQIADTAEAELATAITNGASASEVTALTATATAKRAKADAFATFAPSYVTHLTTQAQSAATTAVANVTSANATALAEITTEVATATTDIDTFYDNQIATAANPPPVDTDLDNDGITDPPAPTATQSITASINAAKTANTTARTTIHTAFADQTARRTTSTTTSYTLQATNPPAGSGGNTGTGGGLTPYQTPGATPPDGTPPVVPLPPTPPGSGNPGSGLPPAFGGSGPVLDPTAQQINELEEERAGLLASMAQPGGHGGGYSPDEYAAWEKRLNEVNDELWNTRQQQTADAELATALERVRRGVERVPDVPSVSASTSTASPQTLEIARAMQDALDDHRRWGRPSDGALYLHLCQLQRESLAEDFKWSNDNLYRDLPTYGTLAPEIVIETTVKPPNSPDIDDRRTWIKAGGTYGVDPNGTWWFRDSRGRLVRYPYGEPDYLRAGFVRVRYSGMTGDRDLDRDIANRQHPIPRGTRLHHTNGMEGQAVDKDIHEAFGHRGGVGGLKRIPFRLPPLTRTPLLPRGGR